MHARRRIETGLGVTVTPFASAREACYRWGAEGDCDGRGRWPQSPRNVISYSPRAASAPLASPSASDHESRRGARFAPAGGMIGGGAR